MINVEQDLRDYQELLEVFVQALIKRGWSTRAELEQRWSQLHEERAWAGGVIVAKAWADQAFKQALLTTGREALREMGVHQGKVGKLVVVENTNAVHNVVVCTLCSCYPYDILGDTPWWYKHESYRTRIVRNPRAVIKDMFGLDIAANKQIRVYDSTSDVRYFVLPQRPKGTDGMSEDDLAKLVTVDSLIGAGLALEPWQLQEVERTGACRNHHESGRTESVMTITNSKFKVGDPVIVACENPIGNPRTPKYIRGKRGIIGLVHGTLENVRDHRGIHQPLYTVRFDLSEVSSCPDHDSIWVDVHEEWLRELLPQERN